MSQLDRAFLRAFCDPNSAGVAPPTLRVPSSRIDAPDAGPRAALPFPGPIASAAEAVAPVGIETKRTLPAPKAPLSAFTSPPKVQDSFRPSFEVNRVNWPATTSALLAEAGDGWNALDEQIASLISGGTNCLGIIGCQRGDGATTISLAIVKRMLQRGLKAVIIDGHFEHPGLADACEISPQCGWSEVLGGELCLEEALIRSAAESVVLLPWQGQAPVPDKIDRMRAADNIYLRAATTTS